MEPENEQMNEQTSSFEVPLEKPFENLQTSLKQLFEMVTDEKTQESVRKMVTQKEKEIKERFGSLDTENLGGVFQKFMSANTDESTQEYIRKMMNESSGSCEPSENSEAANIFGLKFQSCPMFNKNVPNDISSLVAQKKAINDKIANLTPVEEMEFWAQYHNIPTEQVINKKLDQVLSQLESNKVNNGNGGNNGNRGNEGRIAELEEKIDDIYTEITIIRKHLS